MPTNSMGTGCDRAAERFAEQLSFTRDFSSGFIPDRDYRNLAIASQTNFRTALGTSDLLLALSDRPFGADQFYGDFNSWERTKGWFLGATQDLGKRTQVAFGYRRHTDLFVLHRDRPEVFTNRHAVESYQVVLRRRQDGLIRTTVLTLWTSMAAVAEFAGADADAAVVKPAARDVLADFDARVEHFELALHAEP